MVSNLYSTLADLDYGIHSHHGYRSLFKTNAHVNDIRDVYRRIANAIELNATHPEMAGLRPPTILCRDDRATDPVDAHNYRVTCEKQPGQKLATGAVSSHETASVALCDFFWRIPSEPEEDDCPIWTNGRRFRMLENSAALARNQYSILIHEFVHLYNEYDPPYDYVEVYKLQEAVNLDAAESLKNAANYAYYAACLLILVDKDSMEANMIQRSRLDVPASLETGNTN
ncbi:MAG: hypothetical protein Q9219_001357 [cf. Caloplaca sp. 3 TL-2023]